jgi:hypothetical protein
VGLMDQRPEGEQDDLARVSPVAEKDAVFLARIARPGGMKWPSHEGRRSARRGPPNLVSALPWARDSRKRAYQALLQEIRSTLIELDRFERLEADLAKGDPSGNMDPSERRIGLLRRSAAGENLDRRRRAVEELEERAILLGRQYGIEEDPAGQGA